MVRSSKGIRARTRTILRKKPRERGLSPINRQFKKFEIGEKANIIIDSSIHKGQPHPRFHGMTGTVVGNQGRSYLINVKTGDKIKTIIASPEHLRKQKP